MVIWIPTGINRMKKANKGLIVSLFEWIGYPLSKVRWQTNMAVLLLDYLYKVLIMVKKSMVKMMAKMIAKTMGKTTMEIDLMIERFDYIHIYIDCIYIY